MLLRLAFRLMTGDGRASAWRLGLMSCGICVAVLAGLVAWTIPHTLAAGADRAATRFAHVVGEGAGATFRVSSVDDSVGKRPMLRVVVARSGSKRPAAPVGCSAFPRPGTACVSPALAAAMAADAPLRARLHHPKLELIAAIGLVNPDELVIYQGVAASMLPGGSPASGWQRSARPNPPAVSSSAALLIMALLAGIPAILLLATCAQLSAAARVRRTRSLALLGMNRREISTLAAFDGRLAGLIGSVVGLTAYAFLEPLLAGSGVVGGYVWFASDGRLPAVHYTVVVVLTAACAGWLCKVGVRRATADGVAIARPPSLWRVIPLWAGIVVLSVFVGLHRLRPELGGSEIFVLAGAALACAGVVLALQPLLVGLAGWLGRRNTRLPVRLACRRLQWESGSASRMLAALVILVLTASIGSAMARDAQLAAGPQGDKQLVSVQALPVPAAQRDALARLPSNGGFGSITARMQASGGDPVPAGPGGSALPTSVPVAYANCDTIARVTPGRSALPACVDGRSYRVVDILPGVFANGLRPGSALTVSTARGPRTLRVPGSDLALDIGASPFAPQSIVVTTSAPPGGWPDEGVFTFLVPSTDAAIVAFQNRLASVSPAAVAVLQSTDLTALQNHEIHAGIVRLGTWIGFLLGIVAFCTACIDRAHGRRRNVTALFAIGASRRTLASAEAWQLTLPAVVGLSLAAIVGHLVGTAYLVGGGLQHGWYARSLTAGLVLAAVGSACVLASSIAVLGVRVRAENLRRE